MRKWDRKKGGTCGKWGGGGKKLIFVAFNICVVVKISLYLYFSDLQYSMYLVLKLSKSILFYIFSTHLFS